MMSSPPLIIDRPLRLYVDHSHGKLQRAVVRRACERIISAARRRGDRITVFFLLRRVSSLSCLQSVDQDLGGRTGRGRVLTSDQETVLDRVDTPVFDLGIDRAEAE